MPEPGPGELLVRVDGSVPDSSLWDAHMHAKRALIERIRTCSGIALDEGLPILGFARRMTAYKRPDLIFADVERLRAIARQHPFQLVLAGKAHPHDEGGKRPIVESEQHRSVDFTHEVSPVFCVAISVTVRVLWSTR